MKKLTFNENGLHIEFTISDEGYCTLTDFSAAAVGETKPLEDGSTFEPNDWRQYAGHPLVYLQVTGESTLDTQGLKHSEASENGRLRYRSHVRWDNEAGTLLIFDLKDETGLAVQYFMQLFTGIPMVRTWSTVRNVSDHEIGIDDISSFVYEGIAKNGEKPYYDKLEVYLARNSWVSECRWVKMDAEEAGLTRMTLSGYNLPDKGKNRLRYGSGTSWSTSEFLPMGMVRDTESGEIYVYEVEHSGAWQIELGSAVNRRLYAALYGPCDETLWWKCLRPGEEFTTVPASFGVTAGGVSEALAALTNLRRAIRRDCADLRKPTVVFNDYMNCLMGDPREEADLAIIDRAAELGCEYFCLDAGWYDDGMWWDKVGEWKESAKRFPNGLKKLFDHAKAKGLKMGLWLEIEVMGVSCPLAKELPDEWFVMNHGKRRVDQRRYLLDFRVPAVREYCSGVIDRLINEYGCAFFKIDYNVTHGAGSDVGADSRGEAMLEHYRALYDWYREIYEKYPDLIIENCGSGGMRMDYGMLSLHSLQSLSDQTDVRYNLVIAANGASAVAPEQAGMWVYPYEDDAEHVALNMVGGLLLRPYISGRVQSLSAENLALLKEGIALYKELREKETAMVPFLPIGFMSVKNPFLTWGLWGGDEAYLAVACMDCESAQVPLGELPFAVKGAEVIYPSGAACELTPGADSLSVKMPQPMCARLLKLTVETRSAAK